MKLLRNICRILERELLIMSLISLQNSSELGVTILSA